jgi:hypothetical protein
VGVGNEGEIERKVDDGGERSAKIYEEEGPQAQEM